MIKNTKRILAIMLSFAIIAMSMFAGFVVSAAGDTKMLSAEGEVDLLEFGEYLTDAGSTSKYWDTILADNGETGADWANAIIIDSAEELVYLCKAAGDETIGKYYKVADGLAGFDLSKGDIDLNGTLADNIDKIKAGGKNHAGSPAFQGYFDGNGATVYGAWTNHNEGAVSTYAGLFSTTKNEVLIKNIHVKFASFTANSAAGGIVGYHNADAMCTVTIENCSVTDSHIETKNSGWGTASGAIIGYGASAPSYKDADGKNVYVNVAYNIKNCYVNLDEEYFISAAEDGVEASNERTCHGGVAGVLGSNALKVSDCVVIGIKPYATSESTQFNDAQHSGLESHFNNVYTTENVAINPVNLSGTTALANRNFTGKIFPLADDKLKGAAAVDNLALDWSVWMADDEGYPELANAHKNITLVDNGNGTHAATCACGFGGIAVDCTYVDDTCTCGSELSCATRKTITWDGTVASGIATGSGTKDDPYIIKTAAEFAWLIQQKADVTSGKYFEVDASIGKIVLQPADTEAIIALKDAAEVKSYFEANAASAKSWPTVGWELSCFAGEFDGNGVTVYGLYQVSTNNAGLFSTVDGGAAIKNIALKNSYLTSNAGNYQVGGLAAVTSSANYGAKTTGAIWFEGCVVANNYMYNSSTSHDRSGVIIGSSSDVVYIDNCLVYGNDATYGAGVEMPVWSCGNNSTSVSADFVAPEGLELVDDGAETPRYYNMMRNSVIFGTAPYDLAQQSGSRFNDARCFVNVLTDAASGEVIFANNANGEPTKMVFNDEQIKTIAVADLATADLGDAWINTESYPELKSFHLFADVTNNGDGTHGAGCSCGYVLGAEAHVYVDGVCVCGAECAHANKAEAVVENRVDATCTDAGSYENVVTCLDCGAEVSRETVVIDALGHTAGEVVRENVVDATCSTDGSCDEVVYCTVCKEEISRNATVIPATGDHEYDDRKDVDCNVCGEVRELPTFEYGDINDDGAINNKDLGLLMQYINGWNVTVNEDAADVNADGAINNKDYGLLMQYINGWEVELGPKSK